MFLRVLACFPFFLLDCCTGICVSTGVALKCWIFFIICWTVLNVELKSMKRILMMKLKMEETYYSILMFPSYPCRQTAGGPAVDWQLAWWCSALAFLRGRISLAPVWEWKFPRGREQLRSGRICRRVSGEQERDPRPPVWFAAAQLSPYILLRDGAGCGDSGTGGALTQQHSMLRFSWVFSLSS